MKEIPKMKLADIDRLVCKAFEELVRWAEGSRTLGKIARQPNGQHEETISKEFRRLLAGQEWGDIVIQGEERHGSFIRDIVGKQNTNTLFAVEVKTPFTNPGGIGDKTNKPQHLPKDMDSLGTALDSGAVRAYYLWTPIGCYPVDSYGNMIEGSNEEFRKRFGIRWPTSPNYGSRDKQRMEKAITENAFKGNLEAKMIMGWTRVVLPKPRSDLYAFLDCALFSIRKGRKRR